VIGGNVTFFVSLRGSFGVVVGFHAAIDVDDDRVILDAEAAEESDQILGGWLAFQENVQTEGVGQVVGLSLAKDRVFYGNGSLLGCFCLFGWRNSYREIRRGRERGGGYRHRAGSLRV
jgi:hypothetical protein